MTVDLAANWYETAGVLQAAWTWSVDLTIPALGTAHSPIFTPAALVNPYTLVDPTQEASVGHICHCVLKATGVVAAIVWFQFRVPTGTGIWHTFHTISMPLFLANGFSLLSVVIVPCVPQVRIELNNGGGAAACPIEGTFTFVSQ